MSTAEVLAWEDEGMDDQFTGAFPRYSGAISAVTGGPPEDVNMMPATSDAFSDVPIYDGSDLSLAFWRRTERSFPLRHICAL